MDIEAFRRDENRTNCTGAFDAFMPIVFYHHHVCITYSIVPYSSTSVPSKLLSPAYDLLVVVDCSFFIMSLENSILNMIKV